MIPPWLGAAATAANGASGCRSAVSQRLAEHGAPLHGYVYAAAANRRRPCACPTTTSSFGAAGGGAAGAVCAAWGRPLQCGCSTKVARCCSHQHLLLALEARHKHAREAHSAAERAGAAPNWVCGRAGRSGAVSSVRPSAHYVPCIKMHYLGCSWWRLALTGPSPQRLMRNLLAPPPHPRPSRRCQALPRCP